MILRPCHSPQPLIEAASIAAYELREVARGMTIGDLERFIALDFGVSLGVLSRVQTSEDGAFEAVSFEFSNKPPQIADDVFHCSVPVIDGYWRAENALTEAAECFWFTHQAQRRGTAYGRELLHLTDEALTEFAAFRRHLHGDADAKSLNDAILSEVAKKEKSTRIGESNHARMLAANDSDSTKKFLADELHQAMAWWDALPIFDRDHLPHYTYRELQEQARAVFTYRDFVGKVRHRAKRKDIDIKFRQSAKMNTRGQKTGRRKTATT